jgi:hypothetical protein
LQAAAGQFEVSWVELDPDPSASERFGGGGGGATAEEGIEDGVAGAAAGGDEVLEQGDRFLGGVADSFLGTSFQGGDAEDVGGVFPFLEVASSRFTIPVALVSEVELDGVVVVGDANGVLVEERGGQGVAQHEDHFVLRGEGIGAFVVTDGAVPDEEVMKLHEPCEGRAHMQPDMLAFAELAEDEEEAIGPEQALAGLDPADRPGQVIVGRRPGVIPFLFEQDLEVGRVSDDGLRALRREGGEPLEGIAVVEDPEADGEGRLVGVCGVGEGMWGHWGWVGGGGWSGVTPGGWWCEASAVVSVAAEGWGWSGWRSAFWPRHRGYVDCRCGR